MLFMQEGRKVFKEVVPMVSQLILDHLSDENVEINDVKRLWLHQANKSMNDFIGKKVLIDRKKGNYYIGRTQYDSPDVDNEVLIDAKSNFFRVGEFVSAKIYEASDFDLYASV